MVTKQDVLKIAKLSQLYVSESELDGLTADMNNILTYIDQLSQLNVQDVEPFTHVVELDTVTRNDILRTEDISAKLLDGAKHKVANHFEVPRVVDEN